MTHVSLAPYILTDADGSSPRIVFPVSTPAALVMLESRSKGTYVARDAGGEGILVALVAVRAYAKAHRRQLDRLYAQMERIALSG